MALQRKVREAAAAVREGTESLPEPPEPDVADPATGTETAQSLAARYLPSAVRLFAAVAFGKGSRAKLHTRVLAAGHLVRIAGGIAEDIPGLVEVEE